MSPGGLVLLWLLQARVTETTVVKEKQAESVRKSGRANKGNMKERADEFVEKPQAKVGLGAQRQDPRDKIVLV